MRGLLLAGIVALLVPSLFATEGFGVQPPGPTTADAITLRVLTPCLPWSHAVRVDGFLITVEIRLSNPCLTAIGIASVELPPLPDGTYRVHVFFDSDPSVKGTHSFVVRKRKPDVLRVQPWAVRATTTTPTRVRLARVAGHIICENPDCSGVTVRVGGTVPKIERSADDGSVWFTPPPRTSPGFVDVEIITEAGIEKETNALYYFSEPDRSILERILFPVLAEAQGVGGSGWVSEAVIANPNRWWIETWNHAGPNVCGSPCEERRAPRSYERFEGRGYPHGIALLTPRGLGDDLVLSLRVRERSGRDDSPGTSIPVVAEKEMVRNRPLVLADVPRDPRFRVKIRMYAFDGFSSFGTLMILDPVTGAATRVFVDYSRSTDSQPAYAEFDLPAGRPEQRSTIYVIPPQESLAWAFATVTSNETQQVTIVTPGGGAEVPCTSCTQQ